MRNIATVSRFIDKQHPRKDGRCAVSIKVTFNRNRVYYPTKHKLSLVEWDAIHSKDAKKKEREILQDLVKLEAKANDIIDNLGLRFTFTMFEKKFKLNADDAMNIFSLLQQRKDQLEREGRISSAVVTGCALVSLKKFHAKENLSFDELNVEFLNKYKKWMEANSNSSTTIGMYLRDVRTIFNDAIHEGVIPQELYPFRKGKEKKKFVIPTGKNIKKALSLSDIAAIYNYETQNESEAKAKDFWLLSYLGNGVNMKDIALLKFKNIDGDLIRFERAKTKRANEDKPVIITIVITSDIKRIIERWGKAPVNPEEYIFPILQRDTSPKEHYRQIQLLVHFINNNMKRIAKKLGLNAKISTYVARHSFSTVLKNSGVSVEAISEALGHQNIKTTQNYLAGFEDEAKKKMVAELTNFNKLKAV